MRRHHPHFADEETEGQRACPTGSHCRCFRPLSRSAIASLRVVGRLWVQTPDTAAVTRPVRHQHCPRVTSPLLSSRYVTSTRRQTMICQREWSEEANTCNSALLQPIVASSVLTTLRPQQATAVPPQSQGLLWLLPRFA